MELRPGAARPLRCVLFSALFVQFVFAHKAAAQSLIDFEGISGAQVSTQYSDQGVTFNFPSLRDFSSTPGFARSGNAAVELCFAVEFCKTQLVASFTAGQSRVQVFVGANYPVGSPIVVQLVALDQDQNVVGTGTATLGPDSSPIPVSMPLEVQTADAIIREIRAGSAAPDAYNNGLVFDDLTFDTAGPAPACTAASNPSVVMNEPVTGTVAQLNEVLLRGSISTAAPLQSATLTIAGPGNQQSTTDLLGSLIQPTSASFGPTKVTGSLFAGTNVLTLAAQNCHGSTQRSSTVVYDPVAQGTQIRLLGMELVQATQDTLNSVPLISGKPTVLRLYFATMGGPDIAFVRGDVEGYKQGGNTPFLAQSLGTTTVTSSADLATLRNSQNGSMNFLLSPDFYGPGLLNFRVLRLYVDGPGGVTLTCAGCQSWTAPFPDMPRLNLVVQPYFYLKSSKTADAGASLLNGLRYFNNVFPLKGDYPIDDSGIGVTILPVLPLSLVLPRDNDRVLHQLQQILDDLKSQPGSGVPPDAYILGVGPSGGGGVSSLNSKVAYGDSRAIEDTPLPFDPEFYGSTWAQEIGHSFGLLHFSTTHGEIPPTDPAFPYAHGSIGEPGVAIGTEGWNGTPFVIPIGIPSSGSGHAHDFMSYGNVDGTADNTNTWVSPYTYKKLKQAIQAALASTMSALAPATAVDRLVVGGVIDADGKVTLAPGRIARTSFAKGSGETGSLSIVLTDASGRTLSIHRFEPQRSVPAGGFIFNEFVPWVAGTQSIALMRQKAVLATRPVSANRPEVTSVRARARERNRVIITWEASDPDGDPLSFDVLYNSGFDRNWVPVALDFGARSVEVDTSLLPKSGRARFRVRATDGVLSAESDSRALHLRDSAPLPFILSTGSSTSTDAQSLRLEGAAYDPRDGLLPPGRLRWSSDRDGALGKGRTLVSRPLSAGRHVITLTATNQRGTSAATSAEIVID